MDRLMANFTGTCDYVTIKATTTTTTFRVSIHTDSLKLDNRRLKNVAWYESRDIPMVGSVFGINK